MNHHNMQMERQEETLGRLIDKVVRHEGMLKRTLAFGNALRDMVDIQAVMSGDVKEMAEDVKEMVEDVEEIKEDVTVIHSWGTGYTTVQWDEASNEASGSAILGPAPVTETEASGSAILGPASVTDTAPVTGTGTGAEAAPVMETAPASGAAPGMEVEQRLEAVKPTSPVITMTTPTPKNSQENDQETSTLVNDPETSALVKPTTSSELAPPTNSSPTPPAPVPPPPTVPSAHDQLSPTLPLEEDNATQKRRSPRLAISRAASPVVERPLKRTGDETQGGDSKRQKK